MKNDPSKPANTSIRFFDDRPIRSVWDDETAKWWMCASDAVSALTETSNPRVYWATVKRRNHQLFADCKQFTLRAADGKQRRTDVIDDRQLAILLSVVKSPRAEVFRQWIDSLDSTVDERSKRRAYELFENGMADSFETGTVRGLQQIHSALFSGLYSFAGQIRDRNISKGGFMFAAAEYLPQTLAQVERMPEAYFGEIVQKYVEMNVAHPFMEGNGRSMRIWLDLMLKKRLGRCVDWCRIGKKDYMDAMRSSVSDASPLKALLYQALTDRIDDREVYMKGIDYSYYYEEEPEHPL